MKKVKFTYRPLIGGKHRIFLAGDFNNWKDDEIELQENKGNYEIELELEESVYEYKFVVDGNWVVDESAEKFADDNHGGRNSVLDLINESSTSRKKIEEFQTPDWVKDGVFYQIFTDRFCNGNPAINPDFSEWYYQNDNKLSEGARNNYYQFIDDWNDISVLKQEPRKHYAFYGGDLAGVRQKIDYLQDLGINIIYFNPLVKAESNHKYEAFDYFQIDPHLGTNAEFKSLVADLHKNGIRVIVDFAFNHVGVGHFAFRDCLKNKKDSQYYDWFEWKEVPDLKKIEEGFEAKNHYQCWWGHSTMPDLNYDLSLPHPQENFVEDIAEADVNWDVVNHILQVAEFWLTYFDIDGFRLDIPNEVPFWFWKLFNEKVKSIKDDVYLVGELWQNAEDWLAPHYFDAVMNYKYFRDPLVDYFALQKIDETCFLKTIQKGLDLLPKQNQQVMMNLLDSHDTFRFMESCQGDLSMYKLAVIFQMTFVGVPHIFYGDEIGLQGGYDPDNRRTFVWDFDKDEQRVDIHDFYQKIIAIRKSNPALRYGVFTVISAENGCFSYSRKWNSKEFVIVINTKNDFSILELKGKFEVIFNQKEYHIFNNQITIAGFGGLILRKKDGAK